MLSLLRFSLDLNAERNLNIRTQDKKHKQLGADPSGFSSKEFICEFKKRGIAASSQLKMFIGLKILFQASLHSSAVIK